MSSREGSTPARLQAAYRPPKKGSGPLPLLLAAAVLAAAAGMVVLIVVLVLVSSPASQPSTLSASAQKNEHGALVVTAETNLAGEWVATAQLRPPGEFGEPAFETVFMIRDGSGRHELQPTVDPGSYDVEVRIGRETNPNADLAGELEAGSRACRGPA